MYCTKFEAWSYASFTDELPLIKAKTLVIGSDDPFLPMDVQENEVAAKITGAKTAYIKGAGHYVAQEKPLETINTVLAFLNGN